MRETYWEILKRDIAAIGTNLTGNLIGFIVSMTCCVLVFLVVQNNVSSTQTPADHCPKQSAPPEYNQPMPYVPTLDTPLLAEDCYPRDILSFPMVTDIRNDSIIQEQRAAMTHPMIQRHLNNRNQPVPPEYIDMVNYPDKQQGDMPTAGCSRNDHYIKYKPLSEL
jgi:hypothetical protein